MRIFSDRLRKKKEKKKEKREEKGLRSISVELSLLWQDIEKMCRLY